MEHIPSELVAPYAYLALLPGNNGNMRRRFLEAFDAVFFHIDPSLLAEVGKIVLVFHNALLLIDDIEDGSAHRRGSPAAHTVYGVPLTLNSGNLMYFVALQRASKLPKLATPQAHTAVVDEMLNLHHGQGLDIYWRDNLQRVWREVSEEDYFRMVTNKTGGLFRLSVRLLSLLSGFEHPLLSPLADALGVIYQIRDDYCNLTDRRYAESKGVVCEDLIEGKLSLPVLHCLMHSKDSPLHTLLFEVEPQERRDKPQLVALALNHIRQTKSLEYTRHMLDTYVSRAQEMLREMTSDEKPLADIIAHLGTLD